MAVATATLVVADNALAPEPAHAAPPNDLVFTMSAKGMPYDSGKARANHTKQFGSNKVEDVIRAITTTPATPPGSFPATPPHPYSNSTSKAWARALVDSQAKGTIAFNPGSVTVTIKRDSVRTSAWGDVLKTAAATAAVVAATALAIFICFGTEAVGPVLCKAVAGSIGAMTARFIYAYYTGEDMSKPQFWAEMAVYGVLGAFSGGMLELATQFSKLYGPVILRAAATGIKEFVVWLGSWATEEIIAVGNFLRRFLQRVADHLPGAFDRILAPR